MTTALLSREIMSQLGANVSNEELAPLSNYVEATLNSRVIDEVIEELAGEKLVAFGNMHTSSEEERMQWLKVNVPNFKQIIEAETAILLGEIAEQHGQR